VDAAKTEAPGRPVELWAFDEHRLGLKPLARRVWARRGRRPAAVSTHKYQWLYLYGFVRPATGAVEWWLANSVNVPLFQSILDGFADTVGAGPDKTVILLLDGAGWHVSKRLRIPDGIQLCFLPPSTPRNSSLPNTSGRSPTKPSPTGLSPLSTNSPKPSIGGAQSSPMTPPSSKPTLISIGGPPNKSNRIRITRSGLGHELPWPLRQAGGGGTI
jgi:hypothetical protein